MRAIYKYIDRFDKAEIELLVTKKTGPCVSLFLPVLISAGHEIQAAALHLRSLATQAEAQLAAQEVPAAQIEQLLAPVHALAEPNREFWLAQRKGLAIFVAPDCFFTYRLPCALPELVTVDQRF